MNGLPHLLLVEDDIISQQFLSASLQGIPATVAAVGSVHEAIELTREQSFDLWLIDANLPDGDGAMLLARLRASADTPALALTADDQPERRRALLAAGFVAVLHKPLSSAALVNAVRNVLPTPDDPPEWQPELALRAVNGHEHIARRLRALFLAELPRTRSALECALASGDLDGALGIAHRLKASCGFVGASRLLAATRLLAADPRSRQAQEQFASACQSLMDRQEPIRSAIDAAVAPAGPTSAAPDRPGDGG